MSFMNKFDRGSTELCFIGHISACRKIDRDEVIANNSKNVIFGGWYKDINFI